MPNAHRRLPPPTCAWPTAATLGLIVASLGCAGGPGGGGDEPVQIAFDEPAQAEEPADPQSEAGRALAERVEAFAASLDRAAGKPAIEPTSPVAAAPAAIDPADAADVGGPPAVSRLPAATSVVEPLEPARPAVVVTRNDPPAPDWGPPPARPVDVTPADDSEPSLSEAVARRLRDRPYSAAAVLDHEIVRLLEGDGEPQLAASEAGDAGPVTAGDLSVEDQRILGVVRRGLSEFRRSLIQADAATGPPPLPGEKVEPLLEMGRDLRRQIGLRMPTVALCTEVRLFGSYEPMGTSFALGREHSAILYVEVDGFASEFVGDDWQTSVALSATLYDPSGRPTPVLPEAVAVDHSRQRRRDFYLTSLLRLPPVGEAGEHTLKVSVRDERSQRMAQQSLKLTFGTPFGTP